MYHRLHSNNIKDVGPIEHENFKKSKAKEYKKTKKH
jgi:hypothetical protein